MLYDDLVQPGEYLCHHGVKGQRWGVRHFRDTHFSYKTRKAYKNKLISEKKKSKDRDASFKKERGNIIKSHLISALKTGFVGSGAAALVGIGAAAAGTLLGGPAGAITATALMDAGAITIGVASTAQSVANWVNTISRSTTLSDVYKR